MPDEKRPSLREAARRGVEAKQAPAGQPPATTSAPPSAPPTPAVPPSVKPPPPPQRPKPPVVGVEQVAALCGHTVPFELFDLKKDKFRADRRKKLTDKPCRDCRVKAQEERERAEREAAAKLRAERPPTPPRSNRSAAPGRVVPRLPDGSRFEVAWDAGKGEWSGTLAVPGLAPIAGAASGVFRLLQLLDGMYRATSPAQGEAPTP